MKRRVYNDSGDKLLRVEEAEPECGEDFCDLCGDCLSCEGDTECLSSSDGKHPWVIYEKSISSNREAMHGSD